MHRELEDPIEETKDQTLNFFSPFNSCLSIIIIFWITSLYICLFILMIWDSGFTFCRHASLSGFLPNHLSKQHEEQLVVKEPVN